MKKTDKTISDDSCALIVTPSESGETASISVVFPEDFDTSDLDQELPVHVLLVYEALQHIMGSREEEE